MFRRRKIPILIACSLLALAGLFNWLTTRDDSGDEPMFQGRPLSQWLIFCSDREVRNRSKSQAAVRAIGTNAIPALIDWMHYEPFAWQIALDARIAGSSGYPEIAIKILSPFRYDQRKWGRAGIAEYGFQTLGPAGASAAPQLAAIMDRTTSPRVASHAANSLAYIGQAGVAPLAQAISNGPKLQRHCALEAVLIMNDLGTNAAPLIPPLIACSRDTNSSIASFALGGLGRLEIMPELAVPALTNALASPDWRIRANAIQVLALKFTPQARNMRPALEKLLDDPDWRVRREAAKALDQLTGQPPSEAPRNQGDSRE